MCATFSPPGVPVVGVCASGILIRAVAPLLSDKRAEPPVVSVSDDGAVVVPLLGGHRGREPAGGGDRRGLAGAAVTTAGEVAMGVALDAPPAWVPAGQSRGCESGDGGASVGGLGRVTVRGENIWPAATAATGGDRRQTEALARAGDTKAAGLSSAARHVLGVGCARDCRPEELGRWSEAT